MSSYNLGVRGVAWRSFGTWRGSRLGC